MSRKLYVTDEMGLDDAISDIAEVSVKCALMWPWIIPYFDDWGRAEASARRIKGKIFPNFTHISVSDVEGMLTEFAGAGLIKLYEVNGKRYMAVERDKWFRYQTHIHAGKRTLDGSNFPAPPGEAPPRPDDAPRDRAETRETAREIAETRDAPRDRAENLASPSPSLHLHFTTPSLQSEGRADAPDAATPECADAPDCRPLPKRQKIPLPDENACRAYFAERGRPELAESFWDYWESVGWRRQGRTLDDWRATVRTWISRQSEMDTRAKGRASPNATTTEQRGAAADARAEAERVRMRLENPGRENHGQEGERGS